LTRSHARGRRNRLYRMSIIILLII
jgi:hypothetical protein